MTSSSFVEHHTRELIHLASVSNTSATDGTPSARKETLRSTLVALKKPSQATLRDITSSLLSIEEPSEANMVLSGKDSEERELERAVVGKLAVALYAEALESFMLQASQVEAEAEWWTDVQRSRSKVVMYFLSTLPIRIYRINEVFFQTIRSRGIPMHASLLTPSSLRRLFPSPGSLRPNTLLVTMFPHLRTHPQITSLEPAFAVLDASEQGVFQQLVASVQRVGHWSAAYLTMPFELAGLECRYKRKELERIRDARAETLGSLAEQRDVLARALEPQVVGTPDDNLEKLGQFVYYLHCTIGGGEPLPELDAMSTLRLCSMDPLQDHSKMHTEHLLAKELFRPSRLTLLWPKLLILPPLTLYAFRYIYASRASLAEMAKETKETLEAFFQSWLLEPLQDVVKTIRASGDEGVIVSKEGVAADVDSLERMTLALAKEKLNYNAQQLQELSSKIRLGDLTPVLEIYEEDIKSPLRSAISGTLLRSVFIQVQKAKVDIDQALAGIDRLLKSQELTFAFVGVAPSLAILYLSTGYLRKLWSGGRGRGRYGGKTKRAGVWAAMRRIERLLIAQPKSSRTHPASTATNGIIPPLTSGLLLLSVTRLRTYAEVYLPARSRLREGFLEDVEDLEDPGLGRVEKLRVVDRMWKSYGKVLGWDEIAGEGAR